MKHCPKCLKTYDDSWKICLSDSTVLEDGQPTAAFSKHPQPSIADKTPALSTPKAQIIQIVKVLASFGLVIFVFNRIVHSESYAYQSMDSLPLGLIELFTFWPATIFSLVLSIRSAKRF